MIKIEGLSKFFRTEEVETIAFEQGFFEYLETNEYQPSYLRNTLFGSILVSIK